MTGLQRLYMMPSSIARIKIRVEKKFTMKATKKYSGTIPHFAFKTHKPDILNWNKHNNTCIIIDIAVGLDVNSTKKVSLKHNNYMQLPSESKRL